MFWSMYPHTDLHELNLDWVLSVCKKAEKIVDGDISEYIREQLDDLYIDSSYDPETESLILVLRDPDSQEPINIVFSDDAISNIVLNGTAYPVKDAFAQDRKIIIFGDSYFKDNTIGGVSPNFKTALTGCLSGISNIEFEVHSDGGEGFARPDPDSFTYDINAYTSDFKASEVTDVFLVGGFNDREYSMSQIETGMVAAFSAIRTKYPNAKISVGHFGWSGTLSSSERVKIINRSIPAYRNAPKYGAAYMTNSQFTMHNYNLFLAADNIHPTGDGISEIAKQVTLYILTGTCDVHYERMVVEFNDGTNTAVNATQTPYTVSSKLDNDIVTIFMPDANIIFDTVFDLGNESYTNVLQLTTNTPGQKGCFIGMYDDAVRFAHQISFNAYIQFDGAKFAGMENIACVLTGGFLALRNYQINAAGTGFNDLTDINHIHPIGGSLIIPTLEC